MQVAINPSIYGVAQTHAEQRGLNLTVLIENFLERFIQEKDTAVSQDLPDVVVSLLGATGGHVAEDDLNGRKAYHKHLEEKYK